jgi:hypothetical protein
MVGWRIAACVGLGLGLAGGACTPGQFVCQTDAQCGVSAWCEADGSCSFDDTTCPSGRRYGTFALHPNECVPEGTAGTTSAGTDASSSTTSGGASTSGSSSGASTEGTSSTTMALTGGETSGETSGSTGESDAESTGADTTGSPSGSYDFEDDFERADSPDVGNGWVEKTPAAFSLVDGGLRRTSGSTSYPNNLVYRPDETWLDVEAVLELTFDELEPTGHPQFVLRAQLADIDEPGSVTGYLLFVTNGGTLEITRQIAGSFTYQVESPLGSAIELNRPYRMRLSVVGTNPVMVHGQLEERDGAGTWSVHTSVQMTDDSDMRIASAGTLALGAHTELEAWTYEHVGLNAL